VTNLLQNHGHPELLPRWEKYVNEELSKRAIARQSTGIEMESSDIVTLCHGDSWF